MLFLPLLLSVALDMSLPEFEPSPDASGNYIISSVEDGDFTVQELSPDEFDVLPIESATLNDEIVFEPLSIDENSDTISLSRKNHASISSSDGTYSIVYNASSNYYIEYALLSAGVTYDLDYSGNIYYGSSMDYDSGVFLYSGASITPSSDLYLMQRHKSGDYLYITQASTSNPDDPSGNDPDDPSGNDPDDPSGNDPDNPSGGNFDDSRLLVALDSITGQLSVVELLLIFNCFFPLTRKTVHKLMNRKED